MNVEIIQEGRVLRKYQHDGRFFAEAPPEGAYEIRLTNNAPSRRCAIVSVDGINVVNGEDAGVDGPGYVLRPWETLTIPGWRRDGEKVAKFTFQPQEGSYANRTGRGTKNTGIIGVAIFDEKVVPLFHSYMDVSHDTFGGGGFKGGFDSRGFGEGNPVSNNTIFGSRESGMKGATMDSMDISDTKSSTVVLTSMPVAAAGAAAPAPSDSDPPRYVGYGSTGHETRVRRRRSTSASPSPAPVELGTGYGKEQAFHTQTTTFERSTPSPVLVIQLQYAVREKLIQWGVPVSEVMPQPQAFPASGMSVAPPPGWQARR
jgi:hypothetical protein